MKKSVLVTGGTGFIGSYICRYLLAAGYHPVVLKRESSPMDMIQDIAPEMTLIDGDLGDMMQLIDIMNKVDYVIHCAAMLSFKSADRDLIFRVNIEGTANLVNSALETGIKKFIHISSVSAFGKSKKDRVVNEESVWLDSSLNSMYGISKHLAEREVFRACAEGLNALILCPSLVIGAGIWNKGTPSIIKRLSKWNPFYLLGSNGIVDVRDVASLTVKALELDKSAEKVILSGTNISSREFVTRFSNHFNTRPPTIALNHFWGQLACVADFFQSLLTGRDRLLTKDSLKTTYNNISYNNARSLDWFDHRYIPLDQSISDICNVFKENQLEKNSFGILEIS